MALKAHASIGEVLAELREEFPDITISKIRFLESQGLIDPERTPSGYRKFYETDISRLRWILGQQRDNFLPLKVIKDRLDGFDARGEEPHDEVEVEVVVVDLDPVIEVDPEPQPALGQQVLIDGEPPVRRRGSRSTMAAPATRRSRAEAAVPLDDEPGDDLEREVSGLSLTRSELAHAAGLDDAAIGQLEEFGLLVPSRQAGDRVLFDEDSLAIARLASGFFKQGIEARHLRMYRQFAEREALLFEQVLMPLLRQRNPEARAKAREEMTELARLGRGLRAAFLRNASRDLLGE
ncbi:MAG: MerR family regulatory protein [Actinomycetia bacterium]|nr:MerR family regulatory protein [Actinomycetes bacterium]